MKIVVNTRLLLKNRLEGIGRFTFETLKRITKNHPEHHFIFLFDRHFSEEFIFSDNVTPLIISPQARRPLLFYWWFEHSVKKVLQDLKADLFLSPDGYLSISSKTPSLAVIHDLSFEHYPKDVPFLVRKYYKYFFPKFAQRADRIVTVSNFSKQDIITTYNIQPSKIDVVYNGVDVDFAPITEDEKQKVRSEFTVGHVYFLFVGSLHPRKNISRLFASFESFKKRTGSGTKLLIGGARYWWSKDIRNSFEQMKYKSDVIFSGRLSEKDLKKVLASALALVYIPYFEGFGLPLVEAMKSQVPVITSNVTSMPEVCEDAALYADPFSIESISAAMERIENDESLRESLIQKGLVRVRQFSWDKTADELWKSIEKVLIKSGN